MKRFLYRAIGLLACAATLLGVSVAADAAGTAETAETQTGSSETSASAPQQKSEPASNAVNAKSENGNDLDVRKLEIKKVDSCPASSNPATDPASIYMDAKDPLVAHVCPGIITDESYEINDIYHSLYNSLSDVLDDERAQDHSHSYYPSDDANSLSHKVTRVVFDDPAHTALVGDVSNEFEDLTSVVSFDGINDIDTSRATNMDFLFHDDISLTSLDIHSWKTGNVRGNTCAGMQYMFEGTPSLTSLDLHTGPNGEWDVSGVTSMMEMFDGLYDTWRHPDKHERLKTIDITGWDTSNVEDMEMMFAYRPLLTEIKGVGQLKVTKVRRFRFMFGQDHSLTDIDISGWEPTHNYPWDDGPDSDHMFEGTKITSLDLSGFRGGPFWGGMEGQFPMGVKRFTVGPDTVLCRNGDWDKDKDANGMTVCTYGFNFHVRPGRKYSIYESDDNLDYNDEGLDPDYTGRWAQFPLDDDGTGLPLWIGKKDGDTNYGQDAEDELNQRVTNSNVDPASGIGAGVYEWQESRVIVNYAPNGPQGTTVSFDGTPGKLMPQQIQPVGDADTSLKPNVTVNPKGAYTTDGWRVASWNTKADGTGKSVAADGTGKIHFHSGQSTLYAQWEKVAPQPNPGTNPGTNPGAGTNPGTDPGTKPGSGTDTKPGTGSDTKPGNGSGSDSGTKPGKNPGTKPGKKPGANPAVRPDQPKKPGADKGKSDKDKPGTSVPSDTSNGSKPSAPSARAAGTTPVTALPSVPNVLRRAPVAAAPAPLAGGSDAVPDLLNKAPRRYKACQVAWVASGAPCPSENTTAVVSPTHMRSPIGALLAVLLPFLFILLAMALRRKQDLLPVRHAAEWSFPR
ncbi:BspA family leucine-rich repeat surface protein [Bifidobacterium sp. ESL0800]|uniref:BspA family leucine-rich repeat surface protein n=1 Tax=Bifidobacterium sp. ESL0800 TaxID=2983236 RepID=UPI0023F6E039|nr:BspA family leucine-rich repeat surface protein [Bifidobacterium sp. ESL0800]WEV75467.1 BspA family leucine-rich repeat surface protein [Bifidobacterium sp. ESL0800]